MRSVIVYGSRCVRLNRNRCRHRPQIIIIEDCVAADRRYNEMSAKSSTTITTLSLLQGYGRTACTPTRDYIFTRYIVIAVWSVDPCRNVFEIREIKCSYCCNGTERCCRKSPVRCSHPSIKTPPGALKTRTKTYSSSTQAHRYNYLGPFIGFDGTGKHIF